MILLLIKEFSVGPKKMCALRTYKTHKLFSKCKDNEQNRWLLNASRTSERRKWLLSPIPSQSRVQRVQSDRFSTFSHRLAMATRITTIYRTSISLFMDLHRVFLPLISPLLKICKFFSLSLKLLFDNHRFDELTDVHCFDRRNWTLLSLFSVWYLFWILN